MRVLRSVIQDILVRLITLHYVAITLVKDKVMEYSVLKEILITFVMVNYV